MRNVVCTDIYGNKERVKLLEMRDICGDKFAVIRKADGSEVMVAAKWISEIVKVYNNHSMVAQQRRMFR